MAVRAKMQVRIIWSPGGYGLHQRHATIRTGILFQLKSGRTSAPRLPQAEQMTSGLPH
jgi:hypothetical protein